MNTAALQGKEEGEGGEQGINRGGQSVTEEPETFRRSLVRLLSISVF